MKREQLIQALVARKLTSGDKNKAGCVPCFGMAAKTNHKSSAPSNAATRS